MMKMGDEMRYENTGSLQSMSCDKKKPFIIMKNNSYFMFIKIKMDIVSSVTKMFKD